MAIESISGLVSMVSQTAAKPGNSIQDTKGGKGFGTAIKDAISEIDSSQKGADQEIANAVSGKTPDLHKTIIALQTADLKFQLGLQVRNKLIGAYEEIMRMQV